MKTTGVGYINKITTLPNTTTEVAEMTLLCGKDKDGQARKLYGSFIITDKTEGVRDVEKDLNASENGVFVEFVIADKHCVPSSNKNNPNQLYANYRGLLNSVKKYEERRAP